MISYDLHKSDVSGRGLPRRSSKPSACGCLCFGAFAGAGGHRRSSCKIASLPGWGGRFILLKKSLKHVRDWQKGRWVEHVHGQKVLQNYDANGILHDFAMFVMMNIQTRPSSYWLYKWFGLFLALWWFHSSGKWRERKQDMVLQGFIAQATRGRITWWITLLLTQAVVICLLLCEIKDDSVQQGDPKGVILKWKPKRSAEDN